jgi:hypothetical protein
MNTKFYECLGTDLGVYLGMSTWYGRSDIKRQHTVCDLNGQHSQYPLQTLSNTFIPGVFKVSRAGRKPEFYIIRNTKTAKKPPKSLIKYLKNLVVAILSK